MKTPSRKNLWRAILIIPLLISACSPAKKTPTPISVPPTAPPVREPSQVPTAIPVAPTQAVQPTATPITPGFPLSELPVFALYEEPKVDAVAVPPARTPAPDLSNVNIPFVLSQEQLDRLAQDGFVVSPGTDKEFFTLYEQARYDNAPIFVTSDSVLHIYHLLFDKVLRTAEVEHFIPLLAELNKAMLAQVDAQYQELKGTPWEEAARRTVAFIGVGSKLLDPTVEVPAYAADLVEAELAQINAASGILPSPLFPGLENGEDYTQYIPRGHYTKSEELKNYFKSMMWYGRMTFRLKARDPQVGKAETRSALLLVNALRNAEVNGRPAMEAWLDLYSPTAFFVGRSDDLTATQYGDVMDAVYGKDAPLTGLTDEARLDQFIELANQLPPPKILGLVITDTEDETQATKGLRFMGQRFVPDAYIFRQLMYRNVGTRENRRGLPKGLDLPAAMGSERAYQILDQMGETKYENYTSQMEKMRQWLASLKVSDWTETLYNTWLYTFFPLLAVPEKAAPSFMQSPAWIDKQLNTVLGSWTELKHDTILYAKQAYAELGGGPPPPPPVPPKGYVEPVPYFYARLEALTAMTRTGLSERGLLSEQDDQNLARLEDLVGALQTIAEKELRGEPLTDEEYERIRFYGGELEHLTMAAADTPNTEDPNAPKFMEEEPQAAVVADVATDPGAAAGPAVLEEGVGRVNPIYVVVPLVGADGVHPFQVAKGGVFSQFEFPWPAGDRLTDEKWREMLDQGKAPPLADWTSSFITQEGEYVNLTRAVFQFQQMLTGAYWDLGYGGMPQDPVLAPFLAELQSLANAKQYQGHQLINSQFRSFDLQSATKAVVTVRETWQDKLYQFSGDYANYDEQPSATRGPYPLDATYTLENQDGFWRATNVVYANQPPGW
jgi:hypothetical protein